MSFVIKPGGPLPHGRHKLYKSQPPDWIIHDVHAGLVWKKLEACLKITTQNVKPPACIFDLDGTLFDVGYRTLGILKEWTELALVQDQFPLLCQQAHLIDYTHIGYSIQDLLENCGLDMNLDEVQSAAKHLHHFWQKRFFDGHSLLEYDMVMRNAVCFLNQLHALGVFIVYLSGRSARSMGDGTQAQLEKYGFPTQSRCAIVLKIDTTEEDHAFKARQAQALAQQYTLIGNFENEYTNLAAMADHLPPGACHVIFDSHHSGKEASSLNEPVMRIQDYEHLS